LLSASEENKGLFKEEKIKMPPFYAEEDIDLSPAFHKMFTSTWFGEIDDY
jgi:hypothetical protein